MLTFFAIWVLLFGAVTGNVEDDEYYYGDGDLPYDDYDETEDDDKFQFHDSNENKTVNKVHKYHDTLVALFGSDKVVSSLVYRQLHEEPYLSLAQVKLNIREALADPSKFSSISVNQTAEIKEVIKILDEKMLESSETHPESWFMQTVTGQWDNLAAILSAKSVTKYLSELASFGDGKVWKCKDGYLVSLWREVVNNYQTSCDEGLNGCSEDDLKNAVFSIAKISLALQNITYHNGRMHDVEEMGAKNKAKLLHMVSVKRNRAFATKTLGGVQELEDLVQRIICDELTLNFIEIILTKFSKQPSIYEEQSPTFTRNAPVLSNVDDLLTLFEIQSTLGGITSSVTALAAMPTHRSVDLPYLGRNMLDSYMELIDTVVGINSTDVWAQMSLKDVNERLHHMLLDNEKYVGTMSDIILINSGSDDEKYTLEKNSLSVTMVGVKLEKNASTVAKFEFEDTHIWTDDMSELEDSTGHDFKVYSLRYKSWSHMIEDILEKHQNLTLGNNSNVDDEIDVHHSRRVRSVGNAVSEVTSNKSFVGKGGVVSLSTRHNGIKKSVPVTYRIEFDRDFLANVSKLPMDSSFYHCLSCEYLAAETITWESSGCHVVSVNDSGVTCKCNHTTNFAAFMMPAEMNFELTEEEEEIITILSLIGSILSIVGLLFSLMIFYFVRNLVRNERLKAHTNLAVALLAVHILYLPQDFYLKNDSMCVATTALLHYFLLATFMWMLIEGIFLYLYVVQVFLRSKIASYNWMYAVGWLVPAVIVAISAGYGIPNKIYVAMAPSTTTIIESSAVCPEGSFKFPTGNVEVANGNDQDTYARCWLSTDSGMIWSFLAPAVLVLAFNTLIMCKTLQVCVKSLNATSQVRSQNNISKKSGKFSPPTSHSTSTGHSTGHFSSDSYDHSNGDTKRLYTKNTKQAHHVSASPCLLQVTTEEEENCKKETLDNQSKSSSTFTDENNTSHNDASIHVGDKEKEEIPARYHSVSGDSTRYTNSRASFVYRNSVSHNSPRQVARSPSAGNKKAKLSTSDKSHFFKDARTAVKGAVVLLPILGIPWLFGLFAHLSTVLVMLFIFFNATQGVAIFMVYCVFNGEVRRAIYRRLAKIRTRHQVDSSVRRSSSTSTSRSLLRFGRRRSTVTTSA